MAFSQEAKLVITMVLKDEASRGLNNLRGETDKLEQSTGRMGRAFGGVGDKLKLLGIGAVVAGVAALSAALIDGVKSAIEEEKSLARLDASLKANVVGWDGQRGAIDKLIESRMALAFTDDELRESMTILVTRSGNVEQAMKDQGLAMDFARLKGVGLGDASRTIAKALQGNLKALKDMGIELRKGATEGEIFAAVQAKVAGQAEAFANTTEGAMAAAGIALGEVAEDFGELLLPAIKGVADFTRKDLIPAIKEFVDLVGKVARGIGEVAGEAEKLIKVGDELAAKVFKPPPTGTGVRIKAWWEGMGGDIVEVEREAHRLTDAYAEGITDGLAAMRSEGTNPAGALIDAIKAAEPEVREVGEHAGAAGVEGIADGVMKNTNAAFAQGFARLKFQMAMQGRGAVDKYAGGLNSNHDLVEQAILKLKWTTLMPVSIEKERAFLQGQLNARSLAAGLRSNRPSVRKRAEELRDAIKAALEKLKEDGKTYGKEGGEGVKTGLEEKSQPGGVVEKAGSALALAAKRGAALISLSEEGEHAGNTFIWGVERTLAGWVGPRMPHNYPTPPSGGGSGGSGRGSSVGMGSNVSVVVHNNVSVRDIAGAQEVRRRYGARA